MDNNITDENNKKLQDALLQQLVNTDKVKKSDIEMYNPLVLAYIGDAVYETFVRTLLVAKGSMQVSKLHRQSIHFVKAKSQAEILAELSPVLSDNELDIVRRGRNTKSATVPKNAELSDYRYATGFETLIGYLYLMGNTERLMVLFNKIMEIKKDKY